MEMSRGSRPRRISSGQAYVVFAAAIVAVLATGASMELQAQALPDALQSFTGYTKQGDQTMVSPDGFFVLSSSDDAVLAADNYGAYFNSATSAHGAGGLAQFMEVRANPASGLGTFQLETMVVGDGIVGPPSHHRDIRVSGYRDGVVVAQTQLYESTSAELSWPLDYSSFAGQQLDLIRIDFVVVDGTSRSDYNLESFTIDQAQASATPPTVTTASAADITKTSATLGGAVTSEGDEPVTARGVVWSTSTEPTLSDSVVSMGSGPGSFSASVTGLTAATQIHVRAFATSAVGTAYGSEVVFTTLALTPPGTTTLSSPADDAVGVARRPELTWQAATGADSYDVVLSTSSDLSSPIVSETGVVQTAYTLSTDLALGIEHFWRVRAVNEDGVGAWSATASFTTEIVAPTVTTGAVSAVTASGATVGGEVTADGGAAVTARGVAYGTTTEPTLSDGVVTSGSGTGTFSAELSGLAPGTTYYVRAYATNAAGTTYGSETTVSTGSVAATVATGAVSGVTSSGATVAGDVTADGGATVTARGVVYATASSPTLSDGVVTSGAGVGAFSAELSGLAPGVTYYVRAYATNATGTSYGAEDSFTTAAVAPTVTTGSVTGITSSSASIAGEITIDGGALVTARGVVYGTTTGPTLSDVVVTSGSGVGAFSAELSGLAPGTTYYVRAYATNATGTGYGVETTFTTGALAATVTTGAVTAVTSSGASVGGEVTADGGATVTARGVAYGTASSPTLSDGVVTSGTGVGAFSTELSGLEPGTTYHVRAYATNATGTSYGADGSFTTAAVAPTVTTGSVSGITSSTASIAGEVTSDGGTTVTARGVVYGTTAGPTLSDGVVTSASGVGAFSGDLSELAPGTTYHVRAYATNATGTGFGVETTFTTDAVAPTVSTGAVSAVTSNGASVSGEVTADGGATVTARGMVYAMASSPTLADGVVTSGAGMGAFSAELSGLEPGVTYHVRAYATNAAGTTYGAESSFTTVGVLPQVSTGAVTDVTTSGATVAATVTDDGGLTVSARGVVYAATSSPTLSDGVAPSGSGSGAFSATLDGLEPGTTYYARAYATNAIGTVYGEEVTVQVDRLTQTITFEALAERVYGVAPVALAATASSGLDVAFASSDETVVRIENGQVVITGAGEATVTASQAGDAVHLAAASVDRAITVSRRPITGSFSIQSPKTYDGDTDAQVTGRALDGVLAADDGQVALEGGTAAFVDADLGTDKAVSLTGATLSGPRAAHYLLTAVESTTGSIVTGTPHTLRLEGPSGLVAGEAGTYTLTLLDAFGHPTTTNEALTFAPATSLGTGGGTFEPTSVTFAAGASGGTFTYTPVVAGSAPETVSVAQTAGPALTGGEVPTVESTVSAAAVDRFDVEVDASTMENGATVGEGVALRITARDVFGNPVPSFGGTVEVTSDTELGAGGGTTAAFTDGVLEGHQVVVDGTGPTVLTVSAEVGGSTVTGSSPSFNTRFADAQLTVAIESDDERPAIGSEITLRVVVTNVGWAVAGDVVIDPPLADQQRLEPLEIEVDGGVVDGETGAWRIDALASGASATMTIRARVVAP